jgi:hypothetical protein
VPAGVQLLATARAGAQSVAPPPAAPPAPAVAPADASHWAAIAGVHVGLPTGLSAQAGLARLAPRARGDEAGPYVGAEVGTGGYKAGAGVVARGDVGQLILQAAALRTTRRSWASAPEATYVGLEARAMVLFLTVGAGVYLRPDGGSRRVIPALSLGLSR